MTGFVDIHSHMLCNVDDGAGSAEEMYRMLKIAYNDGIRTICFTPHYFPYINYPGSLNTSDVFDAVTEFSRRIYPDMKLLLGNEIMYHNDIVSNLKAGICHSISNSRYVLVEFQTGMSAFTISQNLFRIISSGYIPVLAHVERYPTFIKNYRQLYDLIDRGVVIQMNANSVTGNYGIHILRFCNKILQKGLADVIATDCHDSEFRKPVLSECHKLISLLHGNEYADRLMRINPSLILENKLFDEYY